MMNNFFFCNSDGKINDKYIEQCKFISDAIMKKHSLTGHNDEIVSEYECFTSGPKYFGRKSRVMELFAEDVEEICKAFNVDCNHRSHIDLIFEFHGANAGFMLETLKSLIKEEGDDNAG